MSDNKKLIIVIPNRMYTYFNSRCIDNDKEMPLTDYPNFGSKPILLLKEGSRGCAEMCQKTGVVYY